MAFVAEGEAKGGEVSGEADEVKRAHGAFLRFFFIGEDEGERGSSGTEVEIPDDERRGVFCGDSGGKAETLRELELLRPLGIGLRGDDLAVAVANKEVGRLTKIPGVGKKTAERLLLELQGKFVVTGASIAQGAVVASSSNDIVNALLALGYNDKEADWAVKQLAKDSSVSDGIRMALKLLSKS